MSASFEELVGHIRDSVIGDDAVLEGPFGPRRIIHAAVNGSDEDAVIFCGSGTTGAIDKLVRALDFTGAVVFLGPYEHHSNELPWRESGADVVTIREDALGRVDLDHLEWELRRHAGFKIGTFSAASNVTGIITDTEAVSALLHRHGALAFWDYASAGPYLPIDMTGKDAVFLSPHKFAGGPGTPGVLVAKRRLFHRAVPTVPSGGTIVFVTPAAVSYHPDVRGRAGRPARGRAGAPRVRLAARGDRGPAGDRRLRARPLVPAAQRRQCSSRPSIPPATVMTWPVR